MKTLSRRDFLKLSALAAGGAIAARRLVPSEKAPFSPANPSVNSYWVNTACNMCGGQTGVRVRVDNGRVAKIEPNPDNPAGVANVSTDYWVWKNTDGAAMCPKGNSGIMALYDPDRVKVPLKRTNPSKGRDENPGWVAISWEEALATIADKLKALREAGEAEKLIWFSEDHSFVNIQDDFMKLYGSPNYFNHSNLCDVSRKASFTMVMGDGRPLGDFAHARYILLFGWNPLSATKWSHLPRIFTRAIENGAKLVVVDPYLSQTAARAHEWVPIRPGTDGALALALAHLLIKWNLYDQEFVNEWTVGFDEFAAFVADKTPEWAESITNVPASRIRHMARDLGERKPAVVDVWSGPGQQSNAVQGGRAIALLNVLLGNVDRPGGMINPERKGNAHQKVHPQPNWPNGPCRLDQPRLDNLGKYPFGHPSGVYTEVLDGLAKGTLPYQPKIGVVIFQNLVLSVPGTANVVEALKKLQFLVVVDTMLSETAQLADIVIPGTVYLERYDLTTNWVTWSSVSLRQPVVEPIFGQLPEYEFVAELGHRIGIVDAEGKEFFWIGAVSGERIESTRAWYEEYLSKELLQGGPKMSLEELKAQPGACWVDPKGTRYEKFKDTVSLPQNATILDEALLLTDEKGKPVGWRTAEGDFAVDGTPLSLSSAQPVPVRQIILAEGALWGYRDRNDVLKDASGKGLGFWKDGRLIKGWNTPSRRLEFVSWAARGTTDRKGHVVAELPLYAPRDWLPDERYPLYLINWKEASHTHSRTQNNPYLLELQGWNQLMINAATATRLGIRDGDEIWVESPVGKARAIARVTQGIHPEVVGWQHGFGHWALGRRARGKGTADGMFNYTVSDPISGMALHKEVCVRIYKV